MALSNKRAFVFAAAAVVAAAFFLVVVHSQVPESGPLLSLVDEPRLYVPPPDDQGREARSRIVATFKNTSAGLVESATIYCYLKERGSNDVLSWARDHVSDIQPDQTFSFVGPTGRQVSEDRGPFGISCEWLVSKPQ